MKREIVVPAAQRIPFAIELASQAHRLWGQGCYAQALELHAMAVALHPYLDGDEWAHVRLPQGKYFAKYLAKAVEGA